MSSPKKKSEFRTPRGALSQAPMINSQGENMDLADTYPRHGSREQILERPAAEVREMKHGTTKGTNHPPGYMGFIPSPQAGQRAQNHGYAHKPRATQRCKEDTLFDSFKEKPVGYLGYAPTSVYNRRTWEHCDVSTAGARDKAMTDMGHALKRPEAGGTSLLLNEAFNGPLEGRPSDNGVFNSQIYYKLLRPLEGAARGFHPSSIHPAGRKFLKPSLVMKNY